MKISILTNIWHDLIEFIWQAVKWPMWQIFDKALTLPILTNQAYKFLISLSNLCCMFVECLLHICNFAGKRSFLTQLPSPMKKRLTNIFFYHNVLFSEWYLIPISIPTPGPYQCSPSLLRFEKSYHYWAPLVSAHIITPPSTPDGTTDCWWYVVWSENVSLEPYHW